MSEIRSWKIIKGQEFFFLKIKICVMIKTVFDLEVFKLSYQTSDLRHHA